MAAQFAPGTLVWVKQGDFPWWPGCVMSERDVPDVALPEGLDLWVCCFPMDSLTLAAVHSADAGQIRLFLPEQDQELIEQGQLDDNCRVAIQQAQKIREQHSHTSTGEDDVREGEQGAGPGRAAEPVDDIRERPVGAQPRRRLALRRTSPRKRVERGRDGEDRHRTTHREEEKGGKRRRGSGHGHGERRHGGRQQPWETGDLSAGSVEWGGSSSSDGGDDDDRSPGRRRRREDEGSPEPVSVIDERGDFITDVTNNLVLFTELLRDGRHEASDSELETTGQQLVKLYKECFSDGKLEVAVETGRRIINLFYTLSNVNVTLEQLKRTKIGVAVGQFQEPGFPLHIAKFSRGILSYWFHILPGEVRRELLHQQASHKR